MEIRNEQGDSNNTPLRSEYIEENIKGKALEIYERDVNIFLHQNLSTPVLQVLEYAEGAYLYDYEGRKYLDMHGNGVHNSGFNNPYIIKQVIKALENKQTFTPRRYTNEAVVKLAEKLVEKSPVELTRVLFAPGGSEAVEMAITLAKYVTKRYKTISFWDSFHGAGTQASSVGAQQLFNKNRGPMAPGAFHVDFPNYNNNPWGFTDKEKVDNEVLRQMRQIFEKEGEIACVIGEPISATPIIPTKYFWEKVKELCDEFGTLLIFDEVIEGFGRTGTFFACEQYVCPDILVLGKSLGGGLLPFAGIITKEKYNIVEEYSVGHYTHEKNGLCAIAGLAQIEYMEETNLVENSKQIGKYFLEELNRLCEEIPCYGYAVGLGLHLGLCVVKDKKTMEKNPDLAEEFMYEAMKKGLAFKLIEESMITLRPSLVVTKEDIDFTINVLKEIAKDIK